MNAPRPPASRFPVGRLRPALGIRARLALLVVVALAPLIALFVVEYAREREDARAEAQRRTAEVVQLVGARLDEFVLRIEVILQAAALQVRIDKSSTALNDSVLTLLATRTLGTLGMLNVRDTGDVLLGTSYPIGRKARAATRGRRYFDEAMRTGHFSVGEPVRSHADSTIWIVSFGLPVIGRDGRPHAVVFATVRLDSLRSVINPGTLQGSTVAVIDVGGRIVFRNLESARFVGRDVHDLPILRGILAAPAGSRVAPSALDGVARVVAWQRITRAPWTVTVGVPIAQLLAAERHDIRRDLIVGGLSLALALLVAALVAGRISGPIEALTADARAIGRGDFSRRASIAPAGEIGVLAEQFNAMTRTIESQTNVLRESEERYRTLFETSPLPMVLVDEESLDILVANEAAVQFYGYPREVLLSLTARDIRPEDDMPAFEAGLRGRGEAPTRRRALHRRNGGAIVEVEVSTVRTWAFNRPVWLGVITDLSERERTEAALRESQEQLRQMQKIEAVGRLAAGIAHDFNNLLTGILGSCDLALQTLAEGDPAREELKHARDAAMRATELTKRLLTFSRQQALAPVHIDLRDVVRGMHPLLTRTLGEQVKLEMRFGRTACTVHADPSQVEQVVLNLLVNARDAMPAGGAATVDVRRLEPHELPDSLPAGAWVLLGVTDTGSGMDAPTAARVFEPYFTTKERGKGTGLGLATVYSVVHNAGGQIRLQTAPGVGAAFRIYLPLDEHAPSPRSTPARGIPTAGNGETILLVEDDDAVRRVTTRMVETLGYRVLSAAGPRQALEIARDHIGPIELLLTDVVMPGMNGREMAEAIRKLRPRLHVVYASGYTDDVALLKQLRASALFFLPKPFTTQSLAQTIRTALDAPPGEG